MKLGNFLIKGLSTVAETEVQSHRSGDGSDDDGSGSASCDLFSSNYVMADVIIGEGAFSTVRAGSNLQTMAPVAIKVVDKTKLSEKEEEALKREVSILETISHPKIVQFEACFEESSCYYIIQERMFGGDLLSRIASSGHLPESEAQEITKAVTEALDYLHSKMIAHRDVKPENILITNDHSSKDNDKVVAKLSDFGLAKQLCRRGGSRRHTICGTVSYASPEVLSSNQYGLETDMWSLGIVSYTMLAGYQPFRSEEGEDDEELKKKIVASNHGTSSLGFEEEFWDDISNNCKEFISELLNHNTDSRLSAEQTLNHKWLLEDSVNLKKKETKDEHQVFFMIGSQRSGSNWLRTMLDEREDLAGPHPPHMMRDFMPIIDKFGDLAEDENFRVLVDHLCVFVEKNQVPWTDCHNHRLSFSRNKIYEKAIASCNRLRRQQTKAKEIDSQDGNVSSKIRLVNKGLYVLSIFDAIMEYYTQSNGKRTWICKSMGMSKFHDLLIEFYGESRLRYIYLVRDPRDVAMSFMKTPVGDCHYYAITSKWTQLQKCALKIVDECPQLVHQIHYEQILKEKVKVLTKLYEFIGERRFAGVKRQGSVMCIKPVDQCLQKSKNGRQTANAKDLSYQFQNLSRGDSFLAQQFKKWADPICGLKDEEILMIESVAADVMQQLGYETQLVEKGHNKVVYSEDDLLRFATENALAIQDMKDTLKTENPGDFERRRIQAEVLTLDAVRLLDWENESENDQEMFVSEEELESGLVVRETESCKRPTGRIIKWGTASQRGYSPLNALHTNQDYAVSQACSGPNNESMFFFLVLDGHGEHGHCCSEFAGNQLPKLFENATEQNSVDALYKCHVTAHKNLVNETDIDCTRSGTTSASVLFTSDDKIIVSNLGDSSVILGGENNVAKKLIPEHTPFIASERERVERAGGIIMSMEEKEGLDQAESNNSPPRVWHEDPEKSPGVAFTRSIGDTIAHGVGVIAHPELVEHSLSSNDNVLILCTDGVTEWMDEETCVNLVKQCHGSDPSEAATALVKEARTRWMNNSDYIDDVTAIVIFLGGDREQQTVKTSKSSSLKRQGDVLRRKFNTFRYRSLLRYRSLIKNMKKLRREKKRCRKHNEN